MDYDDKPGLGIVLQRLIEEKSGEHIDLDYCDTIAVDFLCHLGLLSQGLQIADMKIDIESM